MERQILSRFAKMKGVLDNEYILFDNGEVEHNYDQSIYPGQQDLSRTIRANQLKEEIKISLLNNASEQNKRRVKEILELS